VEELTQSLDFSKSRNLEILLLGEGSNVLVSDAGFDGLVIKIELSGVEQKDGALIAGAGENWDALVERAVRDGDRKLIRHPRHRGCRACAKHRRVRERG